jgi:hypothetical protein
VTLSQIFRAAVVCPADDEETQVIPRAELEVLLAVSKPPPSPRPSVSPAVAVCACGISYTASEFAALNYLGVQDGGPHGSAMELRNCSCHSTIAVGAVAPMSDWGTLKKTIPAPPLMETLESEGVS